MGLALSHGQGWNMGYRYISYIQMVFTLIVFLSVPLWKKKAIKDGVGLSTAGATEKKHRERAMPLREVVRIPGAKSIMLTFFCYCSIESTVGLWTGSYLTLHSGLSAEKAASFSSLLFLGIMIGRGLNGFLTFKFSDRQLITTGLSIVLVGIILLLIPFGSTVVTLVAIMLIGLGCAPVYPCLMHSTPGYFGAENSQAIIGVQMASAYVGTSLMPPVFGLIANHINIGLFPVYLLVLLVLIAFMYANLEKTTAGEKNEKKPN